MRDRLIQTWERSKVTVEAESLEEAVELLKEDFNVNKSERIVFNEILTLAEFDEPIVKADAPYVEVYDTDSKLLWNNMNHGRLGTSVITLTQ